ncbi:HEPN domain-containing protein [Vibrio furnissii]|uniref:HEPN domain-containing protein n=1 Tax=Vibrio furnissii TaxID=29494 RepID=UPI00117F9F27|nr:HEPN domain-containing protein [Vibrio furnissii]TRN22023.1 hypothetical protein DM784_17900 [Vibrio furnissii]
MDGVKTSRYIKELHNYLIDELNHIHEMFLKKHLSVDEISIDEKAWERDKKSFIVFSHAAFENYIEVLSIALIDYAQYEFQFNKKITEILFCFIWMRRNSKPEFPDDVWSDTNREKLRCEIDELIDSYKNEITNNNHGIKIKNLNNLLRSVSLDLPENSELVNALNTLTNLRGEFAHRFLEKSKQISRITNTEGPEKIEATVANSYRLAYRLYLKSLEKIESEESLIILKNEYIRISRINEYLENTPSTDGLFSLEAE